MSKSRRAENTQQEAKPVVSIPLIIGAVAVVVLVIAAVLIFTQGDKKPVSITESIQVDKTEFPVKGDPNAPVTLVDFSDYG
jgi:protein-disulfide isomerase